MQSLIHALRHNAVFLLVVTAMMWGGNAVAGKFAVGHISPLLLTSARWVIAGAILLVVARAHLKADWPVIVRKLPYLVVMGGLGFAAFNWLLYTSLTYTTAINVSIVQAGIPMFIFFLNFVVFRLRVLWMQAVGYSLTLVGVLLTALGGDILRIAELQINTGDLIMLVAALVYAAYSVALARKPDIHWLSSLTVMICSAGVISVVAAAWEYTTPAFIWPTTVTGWGVVVYTSLFPSIIGQGFWILGNEQIGGNRAGLYINLVPIFGALLSVLLLGEVFHLYHAVAMALVIGGIVMAQRAGRLRRMAAGAGRR